MNRGEHRLAGRVLELVAVHGEPGKRAGGAARARRTTAGARAAASAGALRVARRASRERGGSADQGSSDQLSQHHKLVLSATMTVAAQNRVREPIAGAGSPSRASWRCLAPIVAHLGGGRPEDVRVPASESRRPSPGVRVPASESRRPSSGSTCLTARAVALSLIRRQRS